MSHPLVLFYAQPARHWTDALPVGNGRMGAMHFGGVERERLQLNEDTLWSGKHRNWNNPSMRELLPQVRAAVRAGDFVRADELAKGLTGPNTESYLPLGDLYLDFADLKESEVSDYRRELDLDAALSTVRFKHAGVTYRREIFASFPDQLIAMRLSADRPGSLSCRLRVSSDLPHETQSHEDGTLTLTGQAPEHVDPEYAKNAVLPVIYGHREDAIGQVLRVQVQAEGGAIAREDRALRVEGADSVIVLLTAATSFQSFDRPLDWPGALSRSQENLQRVRKKTFETLLAAHQADHRELFRRVELDLGPATSAHLPTDERVRRWLETCDPDLVTLFYQYGRYLMIASSRPGSQATNLQGIWNGDLRPPWSSNYTLNINATMNYWPAETCNLAECHQPLFDLIRGLSVTGSETARVNYGARGWMAHHNTDLWRQSSPVRGETKWATWYVGGAWLCEHLWEHYRFAPDVDFLREEAWPLMKGAAEFCLDWLTEDEAGHLVTSLSSSPETNFMLPDGRQAGLSMGSTMDMAIIRELFTACEASARLLGVDDAFVKQIRAARPRLLPHQIGANGCIQEWAHDWPAEDVHHRHLSFLYGLYPGDQITEETTPDLFKASATSLRTRGDAGTGWSLAWKINLWARLRDGDHALALVDRVFNLSPPGSWTSDPGGVYANLFGAHPPFQIDGNFGFTSGIAEMLLQSHAGGIDPLPALPSAWPTGRIAGLRARGGFQVDIEWKNRAWQTIRIQAIRQAECRVRVGEAAPTLRINGVDYPVSRDELGWLTFPLGDGDQADLCRS